MEDVDPTKIFNKIFPTKISYNKNFPIYGIVHLASFPGPQLYVGGEPGNRTAMDHSNGTILL